MYNNQKKENLKKSIIEKVKFFFISGIGGVTQVVFLNIFLLTPAIKDLYITAFHWHMFDYPITYNGNGNIVAGGLGYFIVYNVSSILAQVVNFLVNRKGTFNSNANIIKTLPLFLVGTVAIMCLLAWITPFVNAFFVGKNINSTVSANLAAGICGISALLLYYPMEKFLFNENKGKTRENI